MADETRTVNNLIEMYHSERRLMSSYLACATTCESEGNTQLAKLFRAAAASEEVHARAISKVLPDSAKVRLDVREEQLAGGSGSTAENLRRAIDGETDHFSVTLPGMTQQADSDGMQSARDLLTRMSTVERIHAVLFKEALDQLGRNPASEYHICQSCGNIIERIPKGPCEVCDASERSFQPAQ